MMNESDLDINLQRLELTLMEASQPEQKTAILLGKENLLGSAVELLLAPIKTWKIVRVAAGRDNNSTVDEIKALKPGVVIIYQNEEFVNVQLVMQLLDECPGLRVITVSLESNSIQIYNKQRVWIKNSDDLLSVMED